MVTDNLQTIAARPEKVTGSIAHATKILICLCDGIHKISDIARQTHFSKSTVHRVLKLLEQSQMAVQDTINRRYYLGPLISQLASGVIATHKRLISCADAEMKRLSCISEETVVLHIMMGLKYVSLYEMPSKHTLRVSQESKRAAPLFTELYAGASLKALMAQLDPDRLKILMETINIMPATEHTVTDKKVLMAQLAEIRKQGYAVSRGERLPGVVCVAVPVYKYILPVVLSVAGPEIRLQSRTKAIIAELKVSSGKISKNIADIFGERK